MAVEIYMPKMSDHMEAGQIVRWLASEGDRVEQGQPLLELMTDKVIAVIDAPASGVLKSVRAGAGEGATVPVGETLAFIADSAEMVPTLPPLAAAARGAGGAGAEVQPATVAATPPTTIRAAPAARALAKELGVDLSLVTGTGPDGRIKVEDVRAYAAQAAAAAAQPSPSTPVARRMAEDLGVDVASLRGSGPGGRVTGADVVASADRRSGAGAAGEDVWLDLTSGQKVTGERMLASVQTAPQFTLSLSADMTAALALREAYGARHASRPSVTAILVKVVAAALRQHPRVNASFLEGRLRLHKHISIGVAVGTEQGLVVPVISDADQRSLAEVAGILEALQDKARTMRFASDDLAGGTFTISNLGMYGIERFAAIVNPPEAAILAAGAIVKTPVVADDGAVTARPLMSLTLSVDHRALDGLQGARFLADVKALLENPALAL